MAISITEGCLDRNKDVQVCSSMEQVKDAPVVERATNGAADPEIPFHRHCQKTVCSAYSYNGTGKTWDVIYSQRSNLTNLPTNWIGYFTRNDENITQDLESILELINEVAGTIAAEWYLTFKDNHNHQIARKLINPWTNTSNEYVFDGFGRDINLVIDGNDATTFKFNTMRAMSGEKLSITLPRADLTIKFNDVEIGVAGNICMPNPVTFDIKQDFNKHPTSGYSAYLPAGAPIDGTYHVIRHHQNGGLVTPTFIINTKYVEPEQPHAAIIEWEFHLKNVSDSTMTVNNPVVKVGDDTNWFRSTTALTDQMYVEPGKTNVYVFRADMFDSSKALTYSLAYVY